jgi:hypothetical protein
MSVAHGHLGGILMDYEECDWTCPCGHELDPYNSRVCLVWDSQSKVHRVPSDTGVCECHGRTLRDLERWKYSYWSTTTDDKDP